METVFTAKFSARDNVLNNCKDTRNGSLSNYYDGNNELSSRASRNNHQNSGSAISNGHQSDSITRYRPSARRNLVQSAIETTSVIGNRTIVNGVLVNSHQPEAKNSATGTQFQFEISYPEHSSVNNYNSSNNPFMRVPSSNSRESLPGGINMKALDNHVYSQSSEKEFRKPNIISSNSKPRESLIEHSTDEFDDFQYKEKEDMVKTQTIVVIDKDPITNKINNIKEAFRLDNNIENLEYDQISEYKSNFDGKNQRVININETIKFNRISAD